MKKRHCLGIVGGMGPLAGVRLQELLIEATPATRDQDHLFMICVTDPSIPDRTESLQRDQGTDFTRAIIRCAETLVRAGATEIVMACHTAHSRYDEIQASVSVPVLNLIAITTAHLSTLYPRGAKIGLLMTDGARADRLYQVPLEAAGFIPLLPDSKNQRALMKLIYAVKARGSTRETNEKLRSIISHLHQRGAQAIVLGCTELSVAWRDIGTDPSVEDPLRIFADQIVARMKLS